ncbi:site-specific integrase [Burkholderia anthina]|uniref:Site-specific integrase n=1 Tax=Burkholderia anthina TaxID=179879 RepID=A0A7T7AGC7_9BURK|nr:site-specific integrase [Burkholderia anthina]QQK01542.1 site-specific integrase [Burkholderia anthina]
MKLSTRIAQSRHGVYYYRHQFTVAGKRCEKRFSLRTKHPAIAKNKAMLVSAILVANRTGVSMSEPNDESIENILKRIDADARNLEIVYSSPDGRNITMKADPNVPGDLDALMRASEAFWNSELGQSFKHARETGAAAQPATPAQPVPAVPAQVIIQTPQVSIAEPSKPVPAGLTVQEAISRFATRHGAKLAPKTLYEYRQHQLHFQSWLATRKSTEHYPIRDVTREDIAVWIDDLLAKGITHSTVQQKYLRPVSGLFELAQSMGSFPEAAQFPSRGHKLFTKKDAKKVRDKNGYKPFTDEDLKVIFDSAAYLAQKNPTDYWLPLLGLFTGGRINELCQLLIQDVRKVGDIWAISITDDDECQRLKTPAAKRTIPIHPQLIKLGFLDFVADMKPFGGMLFPYLTANRFGNFSETPSERWGDYLDKVGIADRKKVFHSFRSTSNNRLKQNGVPEETRCQFIGHEHDTVNSKAYSEEHSVAYLLENVAAKLSYNIGFEKIPYPRDLIVTTTRQKLIVKLKRERHQEAAEKRKMEGIK